MGSLSAEERAISVSRGQECQGIRGNEYFILESKIYAGERRAIAVVACLDKGDCTGTDFP